MINGIKNTVPWTYVVSDLNGEETIGTFYEKELQETNQQTFRIQKVIKRKGSKLEYDNSLNSWFDFLHKNDLIFS